MDPKDSTAQIEHMRQFILHEAREQASEIDAKADQEFYMEKQNLVKKLAVNVQTEFDRKGAAVDTDQKIHESNMNNKEKLKVLETKRLLIDDAFKQAALSLEQDAKNESVIVGLIQQGAATFAEGASIKVRSRKEDASVVKAAISKCGNKISFDNSVSITRSAAFVLESDKDFTYNCLGGVILVNEDETVIVDQTFNARLTVCFER